MVKDLARITHYLLFQHFQVIFHAGSKQFCRRVLDESQQSNCHILRQACWSPEYPNVRAAYQKVVVCNCEEQPRIVAVCTVQDGRPD